MHQRKKKPKTLCLLKLIKSCRYDMRGGVCFQCGENIEGWKCKECFSTNEKIESNLSCNADDSCPGLIKQNYVTSSSHLHNQVNDHLWKRQFERILAKVRLLIRKALWLAGHLLPIIYSCCFIDWRLLNGHRDNNGRPALGHYKVDQY